MSARPLPLRVEFSNQNTTYAPYRLWVTMVADTGQDVCFGGTQEQVPFANAFNNSATYQISEKKLAHGIDVYSATSLRFYVSLGNPLHASTFAPKGFGAPTFTNPQDPNWKVRWDIFELTVSSPRSPDDSGDLSTINGYGIPMMIETFNAHAPGAPGTGLTRARSYSGTAPYASLQAMMKTYSVNNNLGGVPVDGIVKNGSEFLRLIGPPNGAFSSTLATGGPFPSLNFYLDKVYKNHIKTPISDVGRISGHSWSLTAGATATQMTLDGKVDGKEFTMAIDADTNAGQANAMYTFSSMIYQAPGPGTNNPGLHFTVERRSVSEADVVSEFGKKTLAEIYHDVFSAYAFGLIGNAGKVTGWANQKYGTMSLNDMGSDGWVKLAGDIGAGKVPLSNVPLFSNQTGFGIGYHNEWASRLYASSPSVYGFAYSDLFQFPIGQPTFRHGTTAVNSWRVTVLPDP